MEDKKVLLIIDGNYLMYKSFWGIRGLITSYGLLVNAVYGFLLSLVKVLEDISPDKVVVIFDGRGVTWRHVLVEEAIKSGFAQRTYKDRTKQGLENFYEQMKIVRVFLNALNIDNHKRKATESDDIIGTLIKRYHKLGWRSILYTKDQDFYQLLKYDLALYKPDNFKNTFDKSDFCKKFIVHPRQWCFVGALMGDGSDTIDGIKGIGIKKACLLAKKYKKFKYFIRELKTRKMISEFGCSVKIGDLKKLRLNYKLKKLVDVSGIPDVSDKSGINRKELKSLLKKYEIESIGVHRMANLLGGVK